MTVATLIVDDPAGIGAGFLVAVFVFSSFAVDWACGVYRRKPKAP